jgi:hypothetical protein
VFCLFVIRSKPCHTFARSSSTSARHTHPITSPPPGPKCAYYPSPEMPAGAAAEPHPTPLTSNIHTRRKRVGGFAFSSGAPAPRRGGEAAAASSTSSASAAGSSPSSSAAADKATPAEKRQRLDGAFSLPFVVPPRSAPPSPNSSPPPSPSSRAEGFTPDVNVSACWPATGEDDHARLLKFLDAIGQSHVALARDSLGASHPFLEAAGTRGGRGAGGPTPPSLTPTPPSHLRTHHLAVTSLYNGFLASSRQYVGDDAKDSGTQVRSPRSRPSHPSEGVHTHLHLERPHKPSPLPPSRSSCPTPRTRRTRPRRRRRRSKWRSALR